MSPRNSYKQCLLRIDGNFELMAEMNYFCNTVGDFNIDFSESSIIVEHFFVLTQNGYT